jgi:hypothetical protein
MLLRTRWRPCFRPVCAAHRLVGYNAIRVPGPDQKRALEVLGRYPLHAARASVTRCEPRPRFMTQAELGLRPLVFGGLGDNGEQAELSADDR